MSIQLEGDSPSPDQRIEEIHVSIGTHADGGEGTLSADLPLDTVGTIRHIPLLSSECDVAEGMAPRSPPNPA